MAASVNSSNANIPIVWNLMNSLETCLLHGLIRVWKQVKLNILKSIYLSWAIQNCSTMVETDGNDIEYLKPNAQKWGIWL